MNNLQNKNNNVKYKIKQQYDAKVKTRAFFLIFGKTSSIDNKYNSYSIFKIEKLHQIKIMKTLNLNISLIENIFLQV